MAHSFINPSIRSRTVANALAAVASMAAMAASLCFSAPAAHADTGNEPLRHAANTSWGMPLGKYDGDRLTGGVIFDIVKMLGASVGRPISQVSLPRKRIEGAALAGEVDLRCYTNPKWTDAPDAYVWSEPLFELADVLFSTDAIAEPRSLSELPKGALISTVLGYKYPTLDAAFASGALRREDAVDQEKVLLKLSAGRTPYGLTTALALDWYKRITPRHHLSAWKLPLTTTAIHCAVPKASPIPPGPIIEALNSLKKSGRIEAILRNYR
jgi:polar amino acid transport system substrate-binding protein